jgi:hypothetical protein
MVSAKSLSTSDIGRINFLALASDGNDSIGIAAAS